MGMLTCALRVVTEESIKQWERLAAEIQTKNNPFTGQEKPLNYNQPVFPVSIVNTVVKSG